MLGTESIGVDELCQPITAEQPVGVDPRLDVSPNSNYFSLKDQRNALRANERNLLADGDGILHLAKEWQPLQAHVINQLKQESKDLEYVAWLIEANGRLNGFEGLAIGFELAAQLINKFWDEITPPIDENELDKLMPIIGLNGLEGNGTLIGPIREIKITQCSEFEFSLWEYEKALELERIESSKKQKKIESGAISIEDVLTSAQNSSTDFYLKIDRDINQALSSFSKLIETMDEKVSEPVPTSNIKQVLSLAKSALTQLAGDKLKNLNDKSEKQTTPEEELALHNPKIRTGFENEQFSSRERALECLTSIADFFRKTEPHSPISYAIEQSVRWSNLSLPELLNELIANDEARNGYFKLSGINTTEADS